MMIMSVRSSETASPTLRRSRCSATRGGRQSARQQRSPGWPTSSCFGGSRGRSCLMRSASYSARAIEMLPDWTAADGALLDELVQLLGPMPVAEEQVLSGLPDLDSEIPEVFTTADLLSPAASQADPFELPHETYAHLLIDEAQDVSPMQWRMLRRRGASASWTIVGDPAQSSWTDSRGSRSRDRGDHRHSAGTALPDEHELSQPIGGLRPGRQGRRRLTSPTPICLLRCAPPATSLGSWCRQTWPPRIRRSRQP